MTQDQTSIHVEYSRVVARLMYFVLANVAVFFVFSFLWVWEYHMGATLSDRIDAIVVPWIWLIAFFVASYLTLRKLTSKALPIAVLNSVVASFVLLVFVHIALAPFFDPMW